MEPCGFGKPIHFYIKSFEGGQGLVAFFGILVALDVFTCPGERRLFNQSPDGLEKIKIRILWVREKVRVKDGQGLFVITGHVNRTLGDRKALSHHRDYR